MTDDQDARDVDRWFASALGDEPAGSVDVDAAVRTGEQRLRHRRMWAVGGVAAAVTVGVVGVGLGTRWVGSSTVSPAAVPGCAPVVVLTERSATPTQSDVGPDGPLLVTTAGTAGSPADGSTAPLPGGDVQPSWADDAYLIRAPATVVAALPAGVVEFSPTPSPDDHGADGAPSGQFWMSTGSGSARTVLTVQDVGGARQARLTLDLLGREDAGPPPCGETVIRRVVASDGTTVDITRDSEAGLVAQAWYPDRSTVRLTLEPSIDAAGQGLEQLPMTPEQLAAVAASPGLSISG